MKEMAIKDILNICQGKLICGDENTLLENFCKDTRTLKKDDIYVGIKGKKYDGNLFYKEAIKKGAKACILQDIEIDEEIIKNGKIAIIIVEDTIKAIGEIANYKRNLYNIPIIAVTGSVGKTSTKDIIASVISEKYKVLKTEGNLNNHIGLPFTILKLKDETAVVLEMGMNHFGEISYLTKIAEPTMAVFTNIGTSHIGNLGSREGILKAKMEILESKKIKDIVINNDNDLLHKWANGTNLMDKNIKIYTYGIENKSDVIAKNIISNEDSSEFDAIIKNESFKVKVKIGGEHFVLNSLCGIMTGKILNIENDKISSGILKFELTKNRMELLKIKNGITVIDDTYNASLDSMNSAIKYLEKIKNKRKIAVLGDMLELGEYSSKIHKEVGKIANNSDIDILITIGNLSKNIYDEVNNTKTKKYHLKNNKETADFLNENMNENDIILFKASNGMNFKEIINLIK